MMCKLFGHRWERLLWGRGFALPARECRRCRRTQTIVHGRWRSVDRMSLHELREDTTR